MKDWESFPKYQPKRPPPRHGIKAKKLGTTWWGKRWIDALERMSAAYGLRLARGRTYARAGRTHDLIVSAGRVTAKVTGSRPKPYDVTLELTALSDASWTRATAAMAEKAQFAAELLAGQMPTAIDEAFATTGTSLFPAREADLRTECSCPDWANPCKHVAATHYVLGEAIDRDPFLLFELRGRSKDAVIHALRAARSGADTTEQPHEASAIPKVTLAAVSAADYDRPRGALPGLELSFDEPTSHAALLTQLGDPATWSGDTRAADLLGPWVKAAANRARQIALSEPTDEATAPEPAATAPTRAKKKQPQKRSRRR